MIKHLTQMIVLAVIFLGSSNTSSSAHHQLFELCNSSEDVLYVSFVHRVGLGVFSGKWTAEGRYIIEPGKCTEQLPLRASAGNAFLGVRKKTLTGSYVDSLYGNPKNGRSSGFIEYVRREFCTKADGAFERSGSLDQLESCPSGYAPQLFTVYLDLWDNKTKKTLTVN